MDKEKLHQYALNKITSPDEIEKILDWIESSKENQKEFTRIKNLWSYISFKNFDSITKKRSDKRISTFKTIRLDLLKYAAIFILAFFIGGYSIMQWMNTDSDHLNEIIVPAGESVELILEDQTHVWLNSGARLTYPSHFERKDRTVTLTGEAFFQVTADKKKPFHVITPEITVNVLGTNFNVEAFNNSRLVHITLVKGKVNIENNDGSVLASLSPNQQATYDTMKKTVAVSNVETNYYTSWKDGIIYFKNEKLIDIAEKLERWFNVKVVFDADAVKELRFTGSILKNKPIDQVLNILKYTSNIDYSIEEQDNIPSIIHLKKGKNMKN